ncbi:tetratricopeptide repeat-containing sensor histidine kinase [uncultured Tenacibaculum sp.]|uniref:tetratricopeptide repeat-containing sensor histidine kinase n=1 Tax=uncultured Tenacibaculum sp. TaxID=174713 RepID=UPI002624837E|nr:tetratricopeptide repeat-containing sensor histidine kinase [uncultured Tenacibaculum sp.]
MSKKKVKYLTSILIADIFDKTHKYNDALRHYKTILNLIKKSTQNDYEKASLSDLNKHELYGKIYLRIGSLYLKQYYNKENLDTLYTRKLRDSSILYFKKLEELNSSNKKVEKYKALSYLSLSSLYQIDSLFNKAKEFAHKAIDLNKKRNDKINLARSKNNLGSIYLSTNQLDKAKKTYLEGIKIIDKNNDPNAVRFKANLFFNLAWVLRKQKDYKAYDYQELSYNIEDKEKEKEIRSLIEEVTARHKETLEQQKVDLVKSQTELLKVQKNKSTLLVSILSILGLIISGVVIYNYRLRQNNLQLKISQNKLIEEQNIDRIKSESQIKILNATIDGKETERKQIAETLHDSVSALLSSANMHLRATKKQFNGNTPVELEKTQQIILEASQKVRDLSHNLVSSILLKFGLGYAIKDIGSKYSNSELHFHTNISNISRYNQEFEIKLYNVIHELINNILKHSKASNAHIVLEDKNGFLSVLIEDDGIGFNYKDNKIKTGLGLNQIEARIQMMNGNFLIESAKEKGTKATITVPIKNRSLVTA